MSLALLARPALRQQTLVRARAFHASRPARSAHDDYHVLMLTTTTMIEC